MADHGPVISGALIIASGIYNIAEHKLGPIGPIIVREGSCVMMRLPICREGRRQVFSGR